MIVIFISQVQDQGGGQGRPDRLLGHGGAGEVQHHAQVLLPPGQRLHPGVRQHEEGDVQEPPHLAHGAAAVQASHPDTASRQQGQYEQRPVTDLTGLLSLQIDENMDVTTKNFGFATKNDLPLYYVSASNGTNVVKLFR